MEKRMSITDLAKAIGVTPRTIMRWEKAGKIRKSKRDWRGWRFYLQEDLDEIRGFFESAYDYDQYERSIVRTIKEVVVIVIGISFILGAALCNDAISETNFMPKNQSNSSVGVVETPESVNIVLENVPVAQGINAPMTEPVQYTLGPNDVIAIEVRRHPEFSGQYAINSEGKIEYKYVGDVLVSGLTKTELKERLSDILSEYIMEPDIDIQILAYLSKVFYVVGEVGKPGKFYMRGDNVTVREALVQAGLPTYAASASNCRLITPSDKGWENYVKVDAKALLFEGDLTENHEMEPGDVLYVPATGIAKFLRVISPVTSAIGSTAGAAASGATFVP
jgi:protein involved in polysaccharide export with SLBB domain